MASGNTLVTFGPLANEPPSSAYATADLRNGHPVLLFDPSADWSAVFSGVLPAAYGGGGLTVTLVWAADTATSGSCRWQAAFERLEAGGTDTDSDSFASAQSAGGTAPGTAGALVYTNVTFTDGGQMDSLAAGEMFRLKVNRDADGTTGTDDMTGNAHLLGVIIKET